MRRRWYRPSLEFSFFLKKSVVLQSVFREGIQYGIVSPPRVSRSLRFLAIVILHYWKFLRRWRGKHARTRRSCSCNRRYRGCGPSRLRRRRPPSLRCRARIFVQTEIVGVLLHVENSDAVFVIQNSVKQKTFRRVTVRLANSLSRHRESALFPSGVRSLSLSLSLSLTGSWWG